MLCLVVLWEAFPVSLSVAVCALLLLVFHCEVFPSLFPFRSKALAFVPSSGCIAILFWFSLSDLLFCVLILLHLLFFCSFPEVTWALCGDSVCPCRCCGTSSWRPERAESQRDGAKITEDDQKILTTSAPTDELTETFNILQLIKGTWPCEDLGS